MCECAGHMLNEALGITLITATDIQIAKTHIKLTIYYLAYNIPSVCSKEYSNQKC